MRAVVVYESMYGNTRAIAEAIGAGLGGDVEVVPVSEATPDRLAIVDLLVVGGPTHVRRMSRPSTRQAAREGARKPDSTVTLEPDSDGPGLREWFGSVRTLSCQAAAFDTRVKMPAALSGRASKRIARLLQRQGAKLVARPESFLVDKHNRLIEGEHTRATAWAQQLVASVADT
jgi:flavodoxin